MSDVLILCYHAVSQTWPAELSVTPDRLEEQLVFLVDRGYRGATFTEAVTSPPAARTVAVTFDDGFRSVLERGLPILSRLGLPATIFVTTDFVGRSGPMAWPRIDRWLGGEHEHELRPVSWADLGELTAHEWEIGSHTRSHARLPTLDDSALEAELRGSREECEERLGLDCRALAYPYGDADERVVHAARAAGYRAAAALPERMHRPRTLEWPRVGVWHVDTLRRFWAKASPARRRIGAFPAGSALLYAERKARKALSADRPGLRTGRRSARPGERA